MSVRYAAVDLGASSGRVIVGDFSSGALTLSESHRFDNGPIKESGSLFWDIHALFEEIKTGIKKATSMGSNVSGIAIDTWGVDYALLKKSSGRFARNPYHYRDSRTNSVPDKIFQKVRFREIYARTGIQFMQLNTIYQLFVHQEAHPEDFDDALMLMMPDALTFLLSGNTEGEYTEASTSQLLNAETKEWDYELIEKIGLPKGIFPKIISPCSAAGFLNESLTAELGGQMLPVYKVGSHDTASAVAAVPAHGDNDWAYLSCGTWSLLGVELEKPLLTVAAQDACFTNEGGLGGKIRFLSNIMGLWLIQECRRIWNEKGRSYSFADIASMSMKVPIGGYLINPNDTRFLAPADMPDEIVRYCVETSQGTPCEDAEIARCVIDSLSLCYRYKLERLSVLLGHEIKRFHVVGGGCKNSLLMKSTSDCCGIPVIVGPVEATAIGNLMAQGIAAGEIDSLQAGRELVRRSFPVEEHHPDQKVSTTWNRLYEKYKSIIS